MQNSITFGDIKDKNNGVCIVQQRAQVKRRDKIKHSKPRREN